MLWPRMSLLLLCALVVVGAAPPSGVLAQPWPEEPPEPEIHALGLPTGWRYIHGDGRHNSPCLGDMTAGLDCVVDTMHACSAWQPHNANLTEGAPGYRYGPDWKDYYHPLCQPLRYTPHHAPFAEPRTFSDTFMHLLEPGIGLVVYRAHGFVFPDIRYDGAPQNPYQIRRGDLIVLRLGFICRGPVSYGTLWEEALADDPDFTTLRARLPEEDCYVPFGAASAVLRWTEGRWWVVTTWTADYLNPWPLLEDFYRSIRK
ncbi:hypothetical protein [Limibacillus sp. MBR-115]|uniref:hypothetical protein n=1 Tax=Limibacillus sp. MBR-115 TaxID=3156465 RepID=UPI00339B404C